MHNLTNLTVMSDITVLVSGANTDVFYSTLAFVGAIVVAAVCAFSIYTISTANETVREKEREIGDHEVEIGKYDLENDRMETFCSKLTSSSGTSADDEKYHKYAGLIRINNSYKELLETKCKENKKISENKKWTRVYVIESVKYIYLYSAVFIILPLLFLSFSGNETISTIAILAQIPLLLLLYYFIIKFIKVCKAVLDSDATTIDSQNLSDAGEDNDHAN